MFCIFEKSSLHISRFQHHKFFFLQHQDPAYWDEAFISIARRALHIRYKILPYMYTQFHLAHTTASMVARPLVFE
jgi:alpha-glucosidase (family GH31 glycosyl hydrolase)